MRVKIWSIGPMLALLRRHEAAAVGEQHDQRGLAHVGGFAAHVRAGDQQHLARAGKQGVVGDEVVGLRFHHRMAAAA